MNDIDKARLSDSVQKNGYPHLSVRLPEKIDFLSRAENYAEGCESLDCIETHMAWVFLTEKTAYKLKKPVLRQWLDFSTIDARHKAVTAEIQLNRRLTADVYISIKSLNVSAAGQLAIGGEGGACDWLVEMRRLPNEYSLQKMLARRTVSKRSVRAIAEALARFYKNLEPIEIDIYEYRDRFERNIHENEDALLSFGNGTLAQRVRALVSRQRSFLLRRAGLFDNSVYSGRIIEGHGDLRPEHVFYDDDVQIIDCLEFCRDFRLLDYYDELSYLALECERSGMPQVGIDIINIVGRSMSDQPVEALLHFYQSYRAAIRTKLAVWHLMDVSNSSIEKWFRVANSYLSLAERHIALAECE